MESWEEPNTLKENSVSVQHHVATLTASSPRKVPDMRTHGVLRSLAMIAAAIILIAGAVCPALGESYIITTNTPVKLTTAVEQPSDTLHILIKARGGQWQQPDYEVSGARISLSANPKALGGSELYLLINPPADLDLHDEKPPILLGIKADGKPLALERDVDLRTASAPPQAIAWGVADRENALDMKSLSIFINGKTLPTDKVSVKQISPRQVSVTVDLSEIDYGDYDLVLTVADAFPQANELQASVRFQRRPRGNYVRPQVGQAVVKVDSCHPSYPSLHPLTDGFKELSGQGASNDVTWASAEDGSPHWIDITLPEPKPLKEVTVYWAYSGSTFFTSRRIQIQVPDNGGWKTVYTSPEDSIPVGRNRTFAFDEVTTNRFRVYQPGNAGPESRPGLMWIAEVEAR